mmetsp:Transcript_2136/g.4980  ORF Transcript_2136/g.4980 Transcript_2136/m.4980 type:complete len:185 (-) Transcript_2136:169-723(-)|eukprot:CAMPEP_0178997054 /NCGR_PEP_ID=MMETSP0795-20121207/8720_1 /TAXON_ID=88552 /ORGANISM="Amoebophrya sp., Strain Ameob2" /LENGTH=184 /DNA_ID=CAMNT_0020689531 /DNA_START=338 /DNA_END=892 /DNA_ORIENTATION=-
MQLFAVAPKDDCPHVTDCLQPLSAYAHIDINSATCQNCPEADENWLCLTCAGVFCSRYKNEHGLFHFLENETHRVWLSFADLSFWCHTCDSYIVAPELVPLRKHFEAAKFAETAGDGADDILAQLAAGGVVVTTSGTQTETGGASSSSSSTNAGGLGGPSSSGSGGPSGSQGASSSSAANHPGS